MELWGAMYLLDPIYLSDRGRALAQTVGCLIMATCQITTCGVTKDHVIEDGKNIEIQGVAYLIMELGRHQRSRLLRLSWDMLAINLSHWGFNKSWFLRVTNSICLAQY